MLAIWQCDESAEQFVLSTNVLVDELPRRNRRRLEKDGPPFPGHIRPTLALGARVYMEGEEVCLDIPPLQPFLEKGQGAISVTRTRRKLIMRGNLTPFWTLLRLLDGARTAETIIAAAPPTQRQEVARLMRRLARAGAVDVSGRPYGRMLHALTKKMTLPHGNLSSEEIARLVADGGYREYSGATRIPLVSAVPKSLRPLRNLFARRRSFSRYTGMPISRAEFEALLTTACGITTTLNRPSGQLHLRAYPSPGALFSVEIYPVALRVEGLPAGVYHYRPVDNTLAVIREKPDLSLLDTILPDVQQVAAGIAAMICLTSVFARAERKYGQGAYRSIAAETGCMAENLVLAATALGLNAGPFSGVVDDLINRELGLDTETEQFMLAVIVGHSTREK